MAPFSKLGRAVKTFSQNLARAHMMAELSELSEAQLKARGLSREQLVEFATRDL